MEACPPPYSPQSGYISDASLTPPTAPHFGEPFPSSNPPISYQQQPPSTNQQPPPRYTPPVINNWSNVQLPLTPPQQQVMSTSSQIPSPLSPVQSIPPRLPPRIPMQNPPSPAHVPMRIKSGFVEIGIGTAMNFESVTLFQRQYIEVQDGVLRRAATKAARNTGLLFPLTNKFVSMEGKKSVCIQDSNSILVIKETSEVRAYQWLIAVSQYCFIAPILEGYCHKQSKNNQNYEERFLKLGSDGVLSWFTSDSEGSDRHDSIQIRGETVNIDTGNHTVICVNTKARDYKFRFVDNQQANLWLAAFQWHSGRKRLRRASVPIRNRER